MRGDPVGQVQDERGGLVGMGGDQREQSPLDLGLKAAGCGMKNDLVRWGLQTPVD